MTSDENLQPPLEPETDRTGSEFVGGVAEVVHEPEGLDPPRQRSVAMTTVAVVAILAAAAGFIGGAAWKGSDSPAAAQGVVAANGSTPNGGTANGGTANGRTANGTNRRGTGFGGYGVPGGFRGGDGGAGRNGTVGQVTAIDGDRITIQDAQGGQVVVTTSSNTTFDVQQQGTISDLKPGDTVVVQGQQSSDGTIAATTVRTGGGFGGFGGGFPGGPGGGAGGAQTPTT